MQGNRTCSQLEYSFSRLRGFDPQNSIGNYMGGCQNYGPFLGTLINSCRIIIGTQKGTIILTTTHIKAPIL